MNKNVDKKNFIWNFLGLTVNSFSSFFFLVIVNRVNGGDQAGIFTFAYSLICLFYFFGVYFSRTYQVSDNTNQFTNREYVYNRIISCIFMFLVTIIYTLFFQYSSFKLAIIFLLCCYRLLEAFSDSLFGILQKNDKLYKAGFSLFIKGTLGVIAFFILDIITKNLIISTTSLVIINLLFLVIYDIPRTKKYIGKGAKILNSFKIFKKTFPIFIFSILNVYLINSSKYTLDYFETNNIQNIFGIILMPGTILSLCCQYLLNPYILKLTDLLNEKKVKEFNRTLLKIGSFIVGLGIMGAILCFFIGIPILNSIYKIELSPYKFELMIIIIGAIFLALISILSSALTIMKKNSIQMYIFIFDALVSLILSIVLVKNYSILGATMTYTITMLLQFINCFIAYKIYIKKEKYNERKN